MSSCEHTWLVIKTATLNSVYIKKKTKRNLSNHSGRRTVFKKWILLYKMLPRRLYLKKVALLWLLHKAVQYWTATFGAGRRRWYKMSRSKVFQLSHPPIVSAVVITSAQVFAVCQLVLLFRKNPLWRVPLSSQWSIDYTKIDVSSTMILSNPSSLRRPGGPWGQRCSLLFLANDQYIT